MGIFMWLIHGEFSGYVWKWGYTKFWWGRLWKTMGLEGRYPMCSESIQIWCHMPGPWCPAECDHLWKLSERLQGGLPNSCVAIFVGFSSIAFHCCSRARCPCGLAHFRPVAVSVIENWKVGLSETGVHPKSSRLWSPKIIFPVKPVLWGYTPFSDRPECRDLSAVYCSAGAAKELGCRIAGWSHLHQRTGLMFHKKRRERERENWFMFIMFMNMNGSVPKLETLKHPKLHFSPLMPQWCVPKAALSACGRAVAWQSALAMLVGNPWNRQNPLNHMGVSINGWSMSIMDSSFKVDELGVLHGTPISGKLHISIHFVVGW